MPAAVRPALRHLIGRRQELDVAFQLTFGLELLHQVLVGLDPLRRLLVLLREDLRLQVVVVEHVRDDVGRARLAAASLRSSSVSSPRAIASPSRIFQVDLVVGGVDARRSCR